MSSITEDQTAAIITSLQEGKLSREEIAAQAKVSPGTVSAVKAHLTMGTYSETEAVIDALETTFGLERDLQAALRSNIAQLEEGLSIADKGKELTTAAGRIDITARDQQGSIVIIELKAGTAPPDCVAQILSYMGTFSDKERIPIRGILVAGDFSPRVIFAARAVPNLQLKKYTFRFSFEPIE